MLYNVEITDLAKMEIKNIANYIYKSSFSEEIANKFYDEIYSKIYSLSIFPEMHPKYNENYRVLTFKKKYRIFYNINKKNVIINYIFSTSQDYWELLY